MVAVIKPPGTSIGRLLNYNENKVREKIAECIAAENFPLDPFQLAFNTKLNVLQKRIDLNPGAKRTSIHISLNFHTAEADLTNEKMAEIAMEYMQAIGFGDQPFLVYRHYDAGHPHIHIVTTNVQANTKLISLHHLGIRKSEPARLWIEKKYGLIPAETVKRAPLIDADPNVVARAVYGRAETKKAIQIVLETVLEKYSFSSLAEFNAVLKLYNVKAEQGEPGSRVFKHKGLLYRILDQDGSPIGVPLKASLFYNNPTLKTIESLYKQNERKKAAAAPRIKTVINLAIAKEPGSIDALKEALSKQGVEMVFRKSETGQLYGITYVDHKAKCVYNGSDLGKKYSAKAIAEQCGSKGSKNADQVKSQEHPADKVVSEFGSFQASQPDQTTLAGQLLQDLLKTEQETPYVPFELKRRKRRKKRKN